MKGSTVLLGFVAVLACSFSFTLQGQELQEGTWTGTATRFNQRQNQVQSQPASLEVKRVPDPHWRWRPGGGELLSVKFVVQLGNRAQPAQVSGFRLENGTLTYSYQQDDAEVSCRLNVRKDGAYEGDCVVVGVGGAGKGGWGHLTLTPPKESTPAKDSTPPKDSK